MDIKFLKEWKWHKRGDVAWISDEAGKKLVADGTAEEVGATKKKESTKDF